MYEDDDTGPKMDWTGLLVPGTNLEELLKVFLNEAISKADGRKISNAVLVIGWEDGMFTQHGMSPTSPAALKHTADILASSAEFWFKKWQATQDPDDYGKEDQYIS